MGVSLSRENERFKITAGIDALVLQAVPLRHSKAFRPYDHQLIEERNKDLRIFLFICDLNVSAGVFLSSIQLSANRHFLNGSGLGMPDYVRLFRRYSTL